MISQLTAFLIASFLLTISPGPDIIFVLVQSLTRGRKAGITIALGLVTGILVHTSLVAFGVSVLLRESASLFLVIRIFGAAYLFWLAWLVYRSDPEIGFRSIPGPESNESLSLFKKGFLMNVLNPKVTLFFLVFFPGFLWAPKDHPVLQFFTLGILFMLQAFLVFTAVAFMAGRISEFLRDHPSSGQIFKWLQVLVFLGIGIFILL